NAQTSVCFGRALQECRKSLGFVLLRLEKCTEKRAFRTDFSVEELRFLVRSPEGRRRPEAPRGRGRRQRRVADLPGPCLLNLQKGVPTGDNCWITAPVGLHLSPPSIGRPGPTGTA